MCGHSHGSVSLIFVPWSRLFFCRNELHNFFLFIQKFFIVKKKKNCEDLEMNLFIKMSVPFVSPNSSTLLEVQSNRNIILVYILYVNIFRQCFCWILNEKKGISLLNSIKNEPFLLLNFFKSSENLIFFSIDSLLMPLMIDIYVMS